jgi:hypothetical protein
MPRNATRVRLELPALDYAAVQSALERGIRTAIGDPAAVIDWYPVDDEGDYVITVKQVHGTWWTSMPSAFAEMIGGYYGVSTMRWRDDKPPAADDE